MNYLWTVLLSFAREPLLTWRAILHLVGFKPSKLRKLSKRPHASHRAVVVGLREEDWIEFDEAYPEFEKTFALKDVLTSELRLALMHRDVAVIAFPDAARRRLAAAIDGLATAIFEASIDPVPHLTRDAEIADDRPECDATHVHNPESSPAPISTQDDTNLEGPRRLRSSEAPHSVRLKRVPRPRAGTNADAMAFLQKILEVLAENTVVLPTILPAGANVSVDTFAPLTLSEVRERALRAPEQAAIIALGLIYKAWINDNHSSLASVLTSAASLPLTPDFLAAIGRCDDTAALAEPGRIALQLFLRALTVREGCDDLQAYCRWRHLDLPLLEAVDYAPGAGLDFASAVSSSRWLVAGKAPPAALSHANRGSDLEIICLGEMTSFNTLPVSSLARCSQSNRIASLKTTRSLRVRPYSESEERLSRHTGRIASAFSTAVADLLKTSEASVWLNALELPIDDLLFGRAAEFWSLLEHLRNTPRAGDTILAGDSDLGMAFTAGLYSIDYPETARIISPEIGFRPSDDAYELQCQIIESAFPEASGPGEDNARRILLKAMAAGSARSVRSTGAAVLIGRNFDRNYSTDLTELGRELRKDRTVIFIPSAGQTIKGRVSTFFDSVTNDWYDQVIVAPAAKLQAPNGNLPALTTRNLLPFLVRFAHRNKMINLTEVALILSVRRQLDAFFCSKFFNYIQAGAETAKWLKTLAPSQIALLPGRDFIAQAACLIGREAGTPTFDVQTVFVGPRSRYKPTKADVQFTIETQSQQLFTSYFCLPIEKTMLTGCSKVGLVQEKVRKLDRNIARKHAGISENFLIVFAGSPFLHEDEPIISAIAKNISAWPNARLGIRLHPTSDDAFKAYCMELGRKDHALTTLTTLDLPHTLAVADVVVTRFSNVGLEAALAGRDVIACNFTDAPPPISLDAMGVAAIALSAEELLTCIEDFRVHGTRWQDLQRSRSDYIDANQQLLQGLPSAHMRKTIDDYIASRPKIAHQAGIKT
ncbi:hypothetical protein DFR48_1192 [Ciceribacter lividus]|uniref:Uncharacterized protein n=1 Tax=Ciceribacter lividus TaxID=1197950 RepID=A0A6I7HHW4_9HYPH|nr:hypothetical protein [Ciceribacter lividus]RCW19728.1 hypothetical protein DFR48_1192 [Ciceribacter lividus]